MDFDEIKRKMDADRMDDISLPTKLKQLEESKIPIQAVRRSMRGEIIMQLLIIVLFFAAPSFLAMDQLPKGIYFILQFITSLITLLYLAKMTWFLDKTSNLVGNSKDTVVSFIHNLKITMEVYKTAIISGSLLLPISMTTLFLGSAYFQEAIFIVGRGRVPPDLFVKFITLDMSFLYLILFILAYLINAAGIYYITGKWAHLLYGVRIKRLENTLREFEID